MTLSYTELVLALYSTEDNQKLPVSNYMFENNYKKEIQISKYIEERNKRIKILL